MSDDQIVPFPPGRVSRIAAESYAPQAKALQHVFLTGDLRKPSSHPYFYDQRVELIHCSYQAGADGVFHWHREITEYQVVLSGRFGHRDAASGETVWCGPGDVSMTPAGVCVLRVIPEATVTIALKVPSRPCDKVFCNACSRTCESRQTPFEESSI